MKATMSFIAITKFLILALTSLSFGQDQKLTLHSFKDLQTIIELSSPPKKEQVEPVNKCSPVTEGLQFCTTTPFVLVKSDGHVTIDVSIQNMTKQNISIIHGNFYDFYNITVTNSKGNNIPSFREIVLKKYKDGTATEKEIVELLPTNSMPRTILLAQGQEYKVQFNLSDYYDFKIKDKYDVVMRRKISKQDNTGNAELSFGNVEVEVK